MPIEPRVRAEGILAPGRPVVALVSGGRDSTCLLGLATRIAGPAHVHALHVDYGLRDGAAGDARHVAALCARLGVALSVHRPRARAGPGNLQAWAREARYAAAARLAAAHDADVATGHTASDQVETVLYRLAASPGRRALLGMDPWEGRLVRPLLGITREETGAWCAEHGLPWRDDPTNDTNAFARNRARHDLLPALRALHPTAEANVLRTLERLRDEATVLDAAVDATLAQAGRPVRLAHLAGLEPALARLVLQRLADVAAAQAGHARAHAPAVAHHLPAVLALGARGGSAARDLGGGLRAVVEYGRLEVRAAALIARPAPALLPVPGRAPFGAGELSCARDPGTALRDGTLDAGTLTTALEVRPWRAGDRMRPLGLGGTRRLQDLFTDRKVPRARRATLPVVLSGGEIAWIPGVATGERFRVTAATRERVTLSWRDSTQGHP